jgi:hypothetical protein
MSRKKGSTVPPFATRFQKGKSGNPEGRPRKLPSDSETGGSAFDILIDRTLTVTRNGVAREATVEEALQHQTYKDAIAGNRSAIREVLKMIERREKALLARRKPKMPIFKRRTEVDPDNANAALLILGVACRDERWSAGGSYEHLLLEPWAVQSALGRRRGGSRLTEKEISEIKRCTRDAGSLRWPRGTSG